MPLVFSNTDIHGKAESQNGHDALPATQPLGSLVHAIQPAAHAAAAPEFHVPMNCLTGEDKARQIWRAAGSLHTESTRSSGGVELALAESEDFLFVTAEADADLPIEQQSFTCYTALLQTLRAHRKPHPLRIWNYITRINEAEGGVERYKSFNSGRRQAFRNLGFTVSEGAPAACALGKQHGPLQIAILAARRPPVPIENPRQTSAYHYPNQYGIDPPIFSRAAWFQQAEGAGLLLISGTASIVGHQTLHLGDVMAQAEETVKNLQSLLDVAHRKAGAPLWRLADLKGRVYVRRAADYPRVKAYLESLGMHDFSYHEADVCRSELLVEIEAEGQALRAS
ncbi:MAG TPA: endoribonuclease L-PSP [Methylibium sp.]